MGLNRRLLDYAKTFSGSSGSDFYQSLFESRRTDFLTEIVDIDGKRYHVEFDTKKSPDVWGVERMSYVTARGVAKTTSLSLLSSREWSALVQHLQPKDAVLERTFWSGLAELTDTVVDYDNGLVIEHPVFENGGFAKTVFGNVRAEKVFRTKVPKNVEGYLCDIDGFDDFFDAVYGIKNVRGVFGDDAYVWTADKGVKVVVRANAEEQNAENRFSLDATIDLEQFCEDKELFGARLCRIRLLD